MIKKDALLKDLKEAFSLEEDIVGKISEFYDALGWRSTVKKESQEVIVSGLSVLKADTEKHTRMIKEMIKYAEGVAKDEL